VGPRLHHTSQRALLWIRRVPPLPPFGGYERGHGSGRYGLCRMAHKIAMPYGESESARIKNDMSELRLARQPLVTGARTGERSSPPRPRPSLCAGAWRAAVRYTRSPSASVDHVHIQAMSLCVIEILQSGTGVASRAGAGGAGTAGAATGEL
jgi:hypothetical protein